jgi:hypothetical protein
LTANRDTEDIAALLDRAGDCAMRSMSVDLALDCYAAALGIRSPDRRAAADASGGSEHGWSVAVSRIEASGAPHSTSSEH